MGDAPNAGSTDTETLPAVFGPEKEQAEHHADSLAVADACPLALPVQRFRGTLVWPISPLLLALAKRDLEDGALPIPTVSGRSTQLA